MTRNDWTNDEPEAETPESRRPDPVPDRELRLRADPPKVMRLSRKTLAIAGGIAAAGLGAALILALDPKDGDEKAGQLYPTGRGTPAEGVATLPRDYTGIPKLGPPLPGEFGKPVLRRSQESGEPIPAGPCSPRTGGRPPSSPTTPIPEAQARLAARSSGLFFASTGNAAGSAAASPPIVGDANPDPEVSGPHAAPKMRSFVSLAGDPETARPKASENVLRAGTLIPAALVTGIQSDLPGLVIAQVTEPVRDSLTGSRILIPQGARLIGTYDSEMAAGQTRLLLAWTRLLLPDGRSIDLGRMPAADPTGQAGLSDRVDNHWGSTVKAALISTILSIGAQSGSAGDESDIARAIRDGASDSISRTGRQIVDRELARRPTLSISPGYRLRVLATQDLDLGT